LLQNNYPAPGWVAPGPSDRQGQAAGRALVDSIDGRVFPLDFELFKYIHKPIYMQTPFTGKLYNNNASDGGQNAP
jgi:hypothetical protein